MGNKFFDTSLFDKAAEFALKAHSNSERRGHKSPYAIHVFEAAAICESITNDPEILAAALLHDTVEDTDITIEDIRREFGDRIASLVGNETVEIPEGEDEQSSWKARKAAAINTIAKSSYDSKIVAMGDKLSNMRAIYRDFKAKGDKFWDIFHNNDPLLHEWHYRGLATALSDLKDTEAYKEFVYLIDLTFEGYHQK